MIKASKWNFNRWFVPISILIPNPIPIYISISICTLCNPTCDPVQIPAQVRVGILLVRQFIDDMLGWVDVIHTAVGILPNFSFFETHLLVWSVLTIQYVVSAVVVRIFDLNRIVVVIVVILSFRDFIPMGFVAEHIFRSNRVRLGNTMIDVF